MKTIWILSKKEIWNLRWFGLSLYDIVKFWFKSQIINIIHYKEYRHFNKNIKAVVKIKL